MKTPQKRESHVDTNIPDDINIFTKSKNEQINEETYFITIKNDKNEKDTTLIQNVNSGNISHLKEKCSETGLSKRSKTNSNTTILKNENAIRNKSVSRKTKFITKRAGTTAFKNELSIEGNNIDNNFNKRDINHPPILSKAIFKKINNTNISKQKQEGAEKDEKEGGEEGEEGEEGEDEKEEGENENDEKDEKDEKEEGENENDEKDEKEEGEEKNVKPMNHDFIYATLQTDNRDNVEKIKNVYNNINQNNNNVLKMSILQKNKCNEKEPFFITNEMSVEENTFFKSNESAINIENGMHTLENSGCKFNHDNEFNALTYNSKCNKNDFDIMKNNSNACLDKNAVNNENVNIPKYIDHSNVKLINENENREKTLSTEVSIEEEKVDTNNIQKELNPEKKQKKT